MPEISELLGLVREYTQDGSPARVDQIASRMGRTLREVERLAGEVTRMGLAEKTPMGIRLTDMGEALVKKQQEEHANQTLVHGPLTGRVRRFLKGNVTQWHGRRRHHGFDDESLHDFHRDMRNLRGHVEDLVSLADLRGGEKCTVVVALGGHGMVQRLAEMGLTPGTGVTIVRTAPMHGPIEVSVRGASLALGRGVARRVLVKPTNKTSPSTAI